MVVRDGAEMVRLMSPRLCDGVYGFVAATDLAVAEDALGWFREEEGVSVIRPVPAGTPDAMRQITLDVHSALDGVGLTAAVSTALAAANIPCNMVAALHHDHVFVPEADAPRALQILQQLSAGEDQT
ncbi:ACT domain-containing protein [Dinoroseobacter sp. S124A]|uniref:ACT domain-containing protein n=1 Tax=Dinoroseobacter sp. S124A TaxID=3415128 RepID=UPI003C7E1E18